MTDISKCSGWGCPVKEDCWRYMAPRGERQTYINATFNKEEQECKHFWPFKPFTDKL